MSDTVKIRREFNKSAFETQNYGLRRERHDVVRNWSSPFGQVVGKCGSRLRKIFQDPVFTIFTTPRSNTGLLIHTLQTPTFDTSTHPDELLHSGIFVYFFKAWPKKCTGYGLTLSPTIDRQAFLSHSQSLFDQNFGRFSVFKHSPIKSMQTG